MSTSYSFGKLFRDIESGFQADRLQTPRLPRVLNDEEWNYYDGQWRREDRPKPQGKKTLKDFLQERRRRQPAVVAPSRMNKPSDKPSSLTNAKASRLSLILGDAFTRWSIDSFSNFSADQMWQSTPANATAFSTDPSGKWSSLELPTLDDSHFTRSGSGICSGDVFLIGAGLPVRTTTPFVWEIVVEAPAYPIAKKQDSMDEQAVQGIRWNRKSIEAFQFECNAAISIRSSIGIQSAAKKQKLIEAYSEIVDLDPMAILAKPFQDLECDSGFIEFDSPKSSIPIYAFPALPPIDARWRMAAA